MVSARKKLRFGAKTTIISLVIGLFAAVLVLAPHSSLAYFHERPTSSDNLFFPNPLSQQPSDLLAFFGRLDKSFYLVGNFLAPNPATQPTAKVIDNRQLGQVKGASDVKKGESAVGKFFKNVGRALASVGDFLWPFDEKSDQAAKTSKGPAAVKTSPVPSASPESQPEELAQTGDLEVGTATDNATVTVAVPDEIDNATLTILGNLIWGDSTADRLTLKGLLNSSILLDKSKTYDLGSSGERFKSGYFSSNVFVGDELRLNSDGVTVKGSMYLNTTGGGSIYLDSDSNTLYLGAGTNTLSNADNNTNLTIDPSGTGRVNFHSGSNFIDSSGNMTIAGTLTSTGGATSSDSIDITPSTNIDALDITGTNITTADLIDLDGTATTTGDAIDINMANTRTSGSAILITDESVAATVTGDLIQINVTGTPDTNTLDIDLSAAASGNLIDLTTTAVVYTGNYIDVNVGSAAQTGDIFNVDIGALAVALQNMVVTNAAASTTAGWLMGVDASAAWTANAINFLQSAGISTGDVIAYDNTGNTATTGDFISFASGTGDADGDVFDITVELGATSTQIFDVNNAAVSDEAGWLLEVDTTGAWTGNAIDFTTGAQAWTGNVLDINFGNAAATGDVVNIDIPALAVAVQNLVVTNAAASSTAGWLASVAASGAWTANAINFDQTGGISTADVLAYDNSGNTATTGDFISFASGTGDADGDVFDITVELGATSTQIFDVNNAAVSDEAGWLLEVDTTGAWTGNMIDIALGAQASTGDIMNVSMGSTNIAGGVLVVANAGGARTDALIDITSASTGDGNDAAALLQLNSTGVLLSGSNILDINRSGGAASNVIDITTSTTASAGNLIDLNFGAILDTGDAINIAVGSTAVGAQALVVTDSTIKTADLISITGSGATVATGIDLMSLAFTNGDGTDVAHNIINMLLTSGGTAATDIARGIFIDLASTAGGTDKAIEIENTAAWDIDIELQFDETINNATDDSVTLTGVGGTNNETFTIDLDSVASSGTTLSSGGTFVLINDNLSVGIDGNTTENIASSDFAFSGNDLYVDDKLGVNGTASIDGNLWQGDAVTTTTKTTAFLFLGTTAGAPTGDPATPAGFAGIVYDTTNNKLCAEEEAAGAAWLCTGALVDIAEWMPAAGAESGDLVSVTDLQNPTEDPTAPFMLAKTTKPYDNKLVGVISKYAEDAESALGYKRSADYHAVTLVGRVPVKVSGEGGPIAKGDYLTSSSTPGHAMKATKAGPVVGMALESFSGGTGTIVAFVKAAWYDPVEEQKRAVLAALGTGSYSSLYGQVLGATTSSTGETETTAATNPLVGPAPDGSLGVLAEEVDLLVHGLLTANNLRVTTAAEFAGTLTVKGLATFEGDLVVKGAFSTGSLDLSGALTKTMTAGSDLSAGDPVVVTGANTVARAGGPSANVVGLAASDAGAGSSVKVAVAGTVGGYSGLAVGARYYVGSGGAVTTAPGGDRAVHIGIAISGSEMIVQIFESAAPPAPPVEDVATVDAGPTVSVDDGSGANESTPGTESTGGTEATSPSPSPESSPEPTSESTVESSPEPSPESSPEPSL